MTDAAVVFFAMIFMHILDDFVLQTKLADMKQAVWWAVNQPGDDRLYSKDYLVCLLAHGFEWSFMVMLPVIIVAGGSIGASVWLIPFNAIVHAAIDHVKCNLRDINLIQDQSMHLVQIIFTFICAYLTLNI